MSMATATPLESVAPRSLWLPLAVAAGCASIADWLFYDWPVGISLALFLAVLAVAAMLCNGIHATRPMQMGMTTCFLAGLIALVEDVNVLSATWSALATALFVIALTGHDSLSWQQQVFEAATTPLRGPFYVAADLFRQLRDSARQRPRLTLDQFTAWMIPLAVFAVFLGLFALANPLIEYHLTRINPGSLFHRLDPRRILCWIAVVCLVWPLILRRQVKPWTVGLPWPPDALRELDDVFGIPAVVRSLVLLNGLFALQTGLDLAYLWGGAALPDGLSHAEYAHRGAYPLLATALLAVGVVLIAMRPDGPAARSRQIRPLVVVWIGQNLLLIISAIFRLDLYVAAYSLTYWRIAAFLWMALVAAGLALMLVQIFLKKPNSWLIAGNAVALAAVLYGCCFINAPRLVAGYNIEHCREIGGAGPALDLQYLGSLGPQSLPALEARMDRLPMLRKMASRYRDDDENSPDHRSWRSFGLRSWRLQRYLIEHPSVSPDVSNPSKG